MILYYNKKTTLLELYDPNRFTDHDTYGSFECDRNTANEYLTAFPIDEFPAYVDGKLQYIKNITWINSSEGQIWLKTNEQSTLLKYLINTDYIISKINEAQIENDDILVASLKQQYSSELNQRKQARVRLNELKSELKQLKNNISEEKE